MRNLKTILAALILAGLPLLTIAAEGTHEVEPAVSHSSGTEALPEDHGHGPIAPTLFHIGPVPVTNAMVYTWIIMAMIFTVIRLGTKHMKEIPSGLQNVLEASIEGLQNLTSGLLEPKVVHWCFPLIATFFIFILSSNLMGLLPGVGSLEFDHKPLFRPPTADANTTVAMAIVFFIMSTWWAIKYNGVMGLVKHIFGVKGGMTGWIAIPMAFVFIFIGMIEVVSILIRPVALSMRLYGNIFGGETVLSIMLEKGPFGIAAVPFYFLELVVGSVQTLVWTVLCIAFIGTLCSHLDDTEHHKPAL